MKETLGSFSLVVLYLEKLRSNVRSISTASSVWLVACPKKCFLFFSIMVSIYFGCAGCAVCGASHFGGFSGCGEGSRSLGLQQLLLVDSRAQV